MSSKSSTLSQHVIEFLERTDDTAVRWFKQYRAFGTARGDTRGFCPKLSEANLAAQVDESVHYYLGDVLDLFTNSTDFEKIRKASFKSRKMYAMKLRRRITRHFRAPLETAYTVYKKEGWLVGPLTWLEARTIGDCLHELESSLRVVLLWLTCLTWNPMVLDAHCNQELANLVCSDEFSPWYLRRAVNKGPANECPDVDRCSAQARYTKGKGTNPFPAKKRCRSRRKSASEIRFSRSEFRYFHEWETSMKLKRMEEKEWLARVASFRPLKPP
jgi:hypothetical protein